MQSADDIAVPWTEHYVRYGFAIVKGLVDREFCDEALLRVRQIMKNDLPLNQWTTANAPVLYQPFIDGYTAPEPVLDRPFDQPRLVAAIEEMFGHTGQWNRARNYYLFLKPYDPDSEAKLRPRGHIDFPGQPVPILYHGFTFQVSLVDAEPFSGNITFFPGSHRLVQKMLMENLDLQSPSGLSDLDLSLPEPVEFIAEAGDVAFYHHLLIHEGNSSHAAGRAPRVALTGEAFGNQFLRKVDPARNDLSPWERSLALNGSYEETRPEIESVFYTKRREYFESLGANS